MPFRNRPKILDQILIELDKDKKPLESIKMLAVIELLVERMYAAVRLLLFVAFALFILTVSLAWQLQGRNRTLDSIHRSTDRTEVSANKAENAANKAENAANKADDDLVKAITASANGSQAAADAIDAIHRLEVFICGGMCPPRTSSTTLPSPPKG